MLNSIARASGVRTQSSRTISIPAPIGGWNARDSLGAMAIEDAVTLTNWWPGTNSVVLRYGYSKFATGITGQVESVISYSGVTANKLFAAATTNIYNITAGGVIGAPDLTSLSNARWQYINMRTSSSYLMMVNGADKLRFYDGTNWAKDGDGAGYDITGVDTATCSNITLFKNRVWLIQDNSLKSWYLPINSIAGAAVALDMSSLAQMGGYLVAAMTWTLDAGYGMDDYLVFITSNGETLVWRLTDPTTPTGISLIGIYQLGAPIGKRCWVKYGGDLLIITQDGVVPMSGALQSSRLDPRVSITNKIQYAMSQSISSYSANFGWDMLYFPKENQLILNVPIEQGEKQQQYVMNNITKSWCNFTGWNANCWSLYQDDPYFGGDGYVGLAWNGLTDNSEDITSFALQSFQTYGQANQKQCQMIRYHLFIDGLLSVYGNVNVDYSLADTSAALNITPANIAYWDLAFWDDAVWGDNLMPSANWQGVTQIGYSFAPLLKTASQDVQVQWVAADLVFTDGGTL